MWYQPVKLGTRDGSDMPEVAPGILNAQLIQNVLIDQWHGRLRALWPKLEDWPRSSGPPPNGGATPNTP